MKAETLLKDFFRYVILNICGMIGLSCYILADTFDQIQAAVDEVVKGLGTVDILVNNAGGGSCIPLEDIPDEEWRKVLFLDLDGAFYCMKYFGKRCYADQ